MSSGKIEQKYFENIENHLIFNEVDLFYEKALLKSHFSESNPNREEKQKEHKINIKYNNDIFVDYNFDMIQKIHFILLDSQDLTSKQKYDFCSNQRFFMKSYLKEIISRI
ncbi:MAG: hypothetical protein ACFFEY_03040 [Candidatus Thorarchaeota archaeon]